MFSTVADLDIDTTQHHGWNRVHVVIELMQLPPHARLKTVTRWWMAVVSIPGMLIHV